MTPAALLHLLRGTLNFLREDPEELRRLAPDMPRTLPQPRAVFLEEETATPVTGFPVLVSEGLKALRLALERYVLLEEAAQTAIVRREAFDRKSLQASWERYRANLMRAVENVTISSYGRNFPAVFWLHHSLDVARLLKETPKRVLRLDLHVGRRHGDEVKYRVFERYLDRVLTSTYDVVDRLADDTEEVEEELFPRLLTRMRDNVLIFTEDHVSRNLAELGSYFNGYLRIDGRDLRRRLEELEIWHRERLASEGDFQNVVRHLLEADPESDGRTLLCRSGYVTYLATRPGYDPARLLSREQIPVWESLLVKLKEFELFHSFRRLILPVERIGGRFVCRGGGLGRKLDARQELYLSPATRPMDFMAPWVVDPLVSRFGMIYDLSDFSDIVSVLRRSGSEVQEDSFRRMFRFQRRVNRLAASYRLQLEKYLGDGAFYSSRRATGTMLTAIHIQRLYRQALAEGFSFDRGLRIALNHGQYRLVPIGRGQPWEPERYEFFGHGLVELSRLTTGKATREIEEIKTMLINQGYPEPTVYRFFSPLLKKDVDIVDKNEEARSFYAYINSNGTLINEGIVATEAFMAELELEIGSCSLGAGSVGARHYVTLTLDDGGEDLVLGVRKLGVANLKGIDRLNVFELVDGVELNAVGGEEPARGLGLLAAVERTTGPALGDWASGAGGPGSGPA